MNTMKEAVARNRFKWARWNKATLMRQRLRAKIFEYEDMSDRKCLQVWRVIARLTARLESKVTK